MAIEKSDVSTTTIHAIEHESDDCDPLSDIIDYLVRVAKISFKNAHVNENEIRTLAKIQNACDLFKKSPTNFLMQFGKYLAPQHLQYFENYQPPYVEEKNYYSCVKELKIYHSEDVRRKRIRNRRYKALQKLQEESDYFSEKEMMFRNPLLYDQLVGQYLTEEEIRERDGCNSENLTFLNIILDTVDRNEMIEIKNAQMIDDSIEFNDLNAQNEEIDDNIKKHSKKHWGDFDIPETKSTDILGKRLQNIILISAPEKKLLHEEFLQEMYSSFVEGRDINIDYNSIDNNEQYDDLQQASQDAEDKYFDSEANDSESLEQHMKLVEVYGRKESSDSPTDDPLDVFMSHLNKQNVNV